MDIYIPISVVEEVDKFKKDQGENGRNARQFSRFIDILRSKGSLSEGVDIEGTKASLFINIDLMLSQMPKELDPQKADHRILNTALVLKKKNPKDIIELITKDINLRIMADVYGIVAKDYETNDINKDSLYEGYLEISVTIEELDSFYQTGALRKDVKLYANQYVVLKDESNFSLSGIGRYCDKSKSIVTLPNSDGTIWGIYAHNMEQAFALDCLLNDEIKLVSLVGKAGTGKTLLAIAAGLSKILDENQYKKLLVSRPIFPMGKDIGYLPGTIEEKLNPWMQPIFDNVEYLMGSDKKSAGRAQELIAQGILNIEPLTYIRGRSIPQQYLIVDEAQNLTPHEMKTILTRAGKDTKIVLTGDVHQIDNPYIDSVNNGLAYVIDKFRGHAIAAHVTLSKGERSELAELAANIL